MGMKNEKNYLDLIPVYSDKISFEKDGSGQITILVENKGIFNTILQKLAKKPRITRIDLQGQGNFVWQCIDGKKSISEIAAAVRKEFGEESDPLYDRLVTYMHTLESCRFIKMKKTD